METAGFDRDEDSWARRWAEAYVRFAAAEMRCWLRAQGIRIFPLVGWAERRYSAGGPGNSVPRFHITWGTGPGVLAPFVCRAREAEAAGIIRLLYRHRVDELVIRGGAVRGVRGSRLQDSRVPRGVETSRVTVDEFELAAESVIVASGGTGGDLARVRASWPSDRGLPPSHMLTGVPAHVDGRMLDGCRVAGARVVNQDRMWHYTEGIRNWDPIWPNHGIRILPGPSSLWLDASGTRLPAPLFPGFDTLGTLRHIANSGTDHTWFLLNQAIAKREFALSGSEQNPDLTGKSLRMLAGRLLARGDAPGPVEAFKDRGEDFVVADGLRELVEGMNGIAPEIPLNLSSVRTAIEERDAGVGKPAADAQLREITRARAYWSERMFRVARPGRILERGAGPLIAVRLRVLTRKTLGGLQTNLDGQALDGAGNPIPGLYAAGEVAGFGGGGMHGYRALEGSFLGGCLFSGRIAGRSAAESVGERPHRADPFAYVPERPGGRHVS